MKDEALDVWCKMLENITPSSVLNSQVGLKGESLRIYQGYGLNSKMWVPTSAPPKGQPLTWYKVRSNSNPLPLKRVWTLNYILVWEERWSIVILQAVVNAPPGDEPVGLDMIHMGKGMAWLNGEEIGRYWPRKSSKNDKCVLQCDYRGKFSPNKCNKGCGEPTQRW